MDQIDRVKIVFFGTAELACPSLSALLGHSGFSVVGVVTQPDRPKGRDLKLQPSAVKIVATESSAPVFQPERARSSEFVAQLSALQPNLIVVAAYGQILPQSILNIPQFGCINVHTSLLPRHRGAAPIQWAILSDDQETGVTIMKMDAGLDTGDILTQESVIIEATDNAQSLHDKLAEIGAALLLRTIPEFIAGRISGRPQPAEGSTYARKIAKEDGQIDWSKPAREIWNRVRAFTPWPGAFSTLLTSQRRMTVKIWGAEMVQTSSTVPGTITSADRTGIVVGCGQGSLRILQVQREGGRRMLTHEFLAGNPVIAGDKFLSSPI